MFGFHPIRSINSPPSLETKSHQKSERLGFPSKNSRQSIYVNPGVQKKDSSHPSEALLKYPEVQVPTKSLPVPCYLWEASGAERHGISGHLLLAMEPARDGPGDGADGASQGRFFFPVGSLCSMLLCLSCLSCLSALHCYSIVGCWMFYPHLGWLGWLWRLKPPTNLGDETTNSGCSRPGYLKCGTCAQKKLSAFRSFWESDSPCFFPLLRWAMELVN